MDEDDIKDKLLEINAIHTTFTDENPLTFIIFLNENKDLLNDLQVKWCEDKIKELTKKQSRTYKKWTDKIDNEISRLPISEKIGENYVKQLQ